MNIRSMMIYVVPPLIGFFIIFFLHQVILLRFEGVVSDLQRHALVSDAIGFFVKTEDIDQSRGIRRFLGLGMIASVGIASAVVCVVSSIVTGLLASRARRSA